MKPAAPTPSRPLGGSLPRPVIIASAIVAAVLLVATVLVAMRLTRGPRSTGPVASATPAPAPASPTTDAAPTTPAPKPAAKPRGQFEWPDDIGSTDGAKTESKSDAKQAKASAPAAGKTPTSSSAADASKPGAGLVVKDQIKSNTASRPNVKTASTGSGNPGSPGGMTARTGNNSGKKAFAKGSKTAKSPTSPPKKDAGDMTPSFDGWIQDFAEAQARAAKEKKDILVLFDGSDWCGWSIQLGYEVLFQPEFRTQAQSRYVLVLADFPQKKEAKARVENAQRNSELARRFGVDGYPSVFVTDAKGRVYGQTGYLEGGVSAFLSALGKMRKVRDELEEVVAKTERGSEMDILKALVQGLKFLEDQELVRYHIPLLETWLKQAKKLDNDNSEGVHELVFTDWWLVRLMAVNPPDAAEYRSLVKELDDWKSGRSFKHRDRGASLYFFAALAMLQAHETEAAGHCAENGMACRPSDPKLVAGLKAVQMAASGTIGSGTGFVVASDGHVLTNRHVVEGASKLLVQLQDRKDPVPATVVAKDTQQDMALIKIVPPQGSRLVPLTVVTAPVRRGSKIGAFGYPLGGTVGGEGLKLTTGVVSATADQSPEGMILLDCRVNPGNSGGPLCDGTGSVVGMVTAKSLSSASVESYGMALPSSVLAEFLDANLPKFQSKRGTTSSRALEWDVIDRRVSPSVVQIVCMGEQSSKAKVAGEDAPFSKRSSGKKTKIPPNDRSKPK